MAYIWTFFGSGSLSAFLRFPFEASAIPGSSWLSHTSLRRVPSQFSVRISSSLTFCVAKPHRCDTPDIALRGSVCTPRKPESAHSERMPSRNTHRVTIALCIGSWPLIIEPKAPLTPTLPQLIFDHRAESQHKHSSPSFIWIIYIHRQFYIFILIPSDHLHSSSIPPLYHDSTIQLPNFKLAHLPWSSDLNHLHSPSYHRHSWCIFHSPSIIGIKTPSSLLSIRLSKDTTIITISIHEITHQINLSSIVAIAVTRATPYRRHLLLLLLGWSDLLHHSHRLSTICRFLLLRMQEHSNPWSNQDSGYLRITSGGRHLYRSYITSSGF